jgi:malate synthase
MTTHMMRTYSLYVIKVCHKRGIHAMGGMAAQIPIRSDAEANEIALNKVRADKTREAKDGHDGTWVAHPGLVQIAREEFDTYMPTPNQIFRQLDDLEVTAADLLAIPEGTITEEGLRLNVDVGIQYMAAWLSGNGCVPIYNLMEDAATAEISRSQVWQWLHNPHTALEDGRPITEEMFKATVAEVLEELKVKVGAAYFEAHNYELAAQLFSEISLEEDFTDFLTLKAYAYLD